MKEICPRFTYSSLNRVIPCSIGDNGDEYVFRGDFFPLHFAVTFYGNGADV